MWFWFTNTFFCFSYIFFVKIIFELILNYLTLFLWTSSNLAVVIIYGKIFRRFWCRFLTALNILWPWFAVSSSCRTASICFSLVLVTLFVLFFRILLLFRFSSIIFSMSVVFPILTRSYFCSSDICCNWSSDFSLFQLRSLKPKLSFTDSVIAFLMLGNVIDWFSSRADSFGFFVRVCWYNSFVKGS